MEPGNRCHLEYRCFSTDAALTATALLHSVLTEEPRRYSVSEYLYNFTVCLNNDYLKYFGYIKACLGCQDLVSQCEYRAKKKKKEIIFKEGNTKILKKV